MTEFSKPLKCCYRHFVVVWSASEVQAHEERRHLDRENASRAVSLRLLRLLHLMMVVHLGCKGQLTRRAMILPTISRYSRIIGMIRVRSLRSTILSLCCIIEIKLFRWWTIEGLNWWESNAMLLMIRMALTQYLRGTMGRTEVKR